MNRTLSAICFCLLAVPAMAEPPMPPMPVVKAIVLSPQATVVPGTNVSVPQNLSVKTTMGDDISLFERTSNEWFQVSRSMNGPWVNLYQLTASALLTWTNSDTGGVGCRIYWGVASGIYTNTADAGTNSQYIVRGLVEGTVYYFAATTYDAVTNGSFCGEVVYTPPIIAPKFNRP